jgi:CheY-like chemotaxis protein
LLNCISRVHRFKLVSRVRQERLVCNFRDIVLLLFFLGEYCVDATPDGGEVVLEICCEGTESAQNPPGLVFRFLDRGPGFSESILTSLKGPFITIKGDFPNRWLGLYAARILAERHHGFLSIARTNEHQTVVGASFPAAVEEVRSEAHTANMGKVQRRQYGLSNQCFLVVEDDEAMRTLLLNRLQRRGHMVFCVDTCTEGLEEYSMLYDTITTVLMDVGLWDASGYDCYRKMLAINPKVRVIFMSGQDEMIPEEISDNTVFLQKPFTIDQLEMAVHDVHI